MGADISRERFDPLNDYSGVLLQQGRVILDSDWNEFQSLTGRRLRAGAADLGSRGPAPGSTGVAVVPRTTPDGFAVAVAGGVMTLGVGRLYVDGILAENHGSGTRVWDPLLAEEHGSAPTPYLAQPYWPNPVALPTSGRHVVYLDVWERELTALERPDLVEVAVGVDTTARAQVAWQVRVLEDDATGIDCATKDEDVPGWRGVIEPSAGRLSTGTVPVDVTDDPCELPPSGGYRGLENQTYRIEIHDAGGPGTATCKWSRDDGIVAAPVEEVSPLLIRPSSLGKDDVLRFHTGDWVEVLDDLRELNRLPGDMRRVEVHDDRGTMTFTPALSPDLVMSPAEARARRLRVRRWDQHGEVRRVDGALVTDLAISTNGVIPVPADGAAVVLEHGVTVQLRSPGGTFHQGDYWVFAARTSDSSVEILTDAPPRGTHHHYARLGVAAFPDTPRDEGDCRVLWPPECGGGDCGDCAVCVTPESHADGTLTIQEAVDLLKETGGTVCLSVGQYRLDKPIVIENSLASVRGAGSGTVIMTNAGAFAIRGGSAYGSVTDLTIISGGRVPAIVLDGTYHFSIESLSLTVFYEEGDTHDDVPAIAARGWNVNTRVWRCDIYAPIGLSSVWKEGTPLSTTGLDVRECTFSCWVAGVWFDAECVHFLDNHICDNYVGGARNGGIIAMGSVEHRSSRLEVSRNLVQAPGHGIVVGTVGCSVLENSVTGLQTDAGADGIVVGLEGSADNRGAVWIARNEVTGVLGSGIVCRAPVVDLRVEDNLISAAQGDGIAMTGRASADMVTIVRNQLRDVVMTPMRWGGDDAGIQVLRARQATVSQNTVRGVAQDGGEKNGLAGIRLIAVGTGHVDDNTVEGVGSDSDSPKVGIEVPGPFEHVHARGNTARRTADDAAAPAASWTGVLVGALRNGGGPPLRTHGRMFTLEGRRTLAIGPHFAAAAAAADPSALTAIVDNNTATGGLTTPAIAVRVPGDALVSGNHGAVSESSRAPAIGVQARTATLQGNRARRGRPASIVIDAPLNALAALGNVTTRGIVDGSGSALPPPWDVANPDGV